MEPEEYILVDDVETTFRQLKECDYFRFIGSKIVWTVMEDRYMSLIIDSGKTHKEISFNEYYKGDKYHNCQKGDRRVMKMKFIKNPCLNNQNKQP
jgi:hypothetical protein